jgi:hypothetical protein
LIDAGISWILPSPVSAILSALDLETVVPTTTRFAWVEVKDHVLESAIKWVQIQMLLASVTSLVSTSETAALTTMNSVGTVLTLVIEI